MAEEPLIMVCTSCGSVEVVTSENEEDAWTDITNTVRRHQAQSSACRGSQQWFGQDLQDCPFPYSLPEGPVN